MPRPSFRGLSKSSNGGWNVHYQHHSPTLRFNINSKPGKYFSIKQKDDGELSIRYYDYSLRIGFKHPAYSEALKELFPDFHGDEMDAEKFIHDNQEKLSSVINGSIYHYCLEHNKEFKEYDEIYRGSDMIYCQLSDSGDMEVLIQKYSELVKCTSRDVKDAIEKYILDIQSSDSYAETEQTARERSIIHHYPGEKET